MDERFCTVNGGIELCYSTFGDSAAPTVLLIMGLGMQMIAWSDEFCGELAGRGFHVVRFDNRDAGRSTHLPDLPVPSALQLVTRRVKPGYKLGDMADDAIGLLDHLGIERAHVVGASMGGMIAQVLAIRNPARVLSLTSIMSNPGDRWSGQPSPAIYPVMLSAPPADKAAAADHVVRLFKAIGSPGFATDEPALREMAALSWDRGHDGRATPRQLAAIIGSEDRRSGLRGLTMPALVVHGTKDRLVRPSGGRATAKAIPGARLLMIDGMGHDMPREAWPRILDAFVETASSAAKTSAGAPAGG